MTNDLFSDSSPSETPSNKGGEDGDAQERRRKVETAGRGFEPLASRLRPNALLDVVGQEHLLGSQGVLSAMLKQGTLPSLIFWGGPGCGKTTIAQLLAQHVERVFAQISAVFSGVADLKRIFDAARKRSESSGRGTVLFVDEIHRFNRTQQDSFLPYIEQGIVTLIGATTENPSFALNKALLSRCRVLVVNRLDLSSLDLLLSRAETMMGQALPVDAKARKALCEMADGDGRYLLNMSEQLFALPPGAALTAAQLSHHVAQRAAHYDRDRDEHYNLISALHKSLRGSDPDAALYWFARMLEGGEDPIYLARRLTRFAAEDIGLAAPSALGITLAAWQSYERLGSPEGELALAEAVIFLACAPKSNATYVAYRHARTLARETGSLPPPKHILNAPTQLMRELGYAQGYAYDHDAEGAFSGQNYFPEGVERVTLYQPSAFGEEVKLQKRLEALFEARKLKRS